MVLVHSIKAQALEMLFNRELQIKRLEMMIQNAKHYAVDNILEAKKIQKTKK